MKFITQTDRYKYFLIKKGTIILKNLSLTKLKGRLSGTKVILNSLPKSGTHLIEALFFELPMMGHYGGRTIIINNQDDTFEQNSKKLRSIKKGQFAPTHIQFNDKVYNVILNENIKVVQIVRDPRDVLISHLLYIRDLDKTHKSSAYINSIKGDIEQFKAIIKGREDIIEPFSDVAKKFFGWLTKPDTLIIKFEDLVGKSGGGSDELQATATQKVIDFLGLQLTEKQLTKINAKIFSSKSPTFNTGKINKWKSYFTPEHKKICKEQIQDILEMLGYEKDMSW